VQNHRSEVEDFMAIIGAHALLYSSQADDLRAMLRDVFGLKHIDAGGGWLIFTLPPAELGIHPIEEGMTRTGAPHKLNFMCDDIRATITELRAKGVTVKGEPQDQGFGITAMLDLPGGAEVMLYEPRHPVALDTRAPLFGRALATLLSEALDGPSGNAYFLNRGDRGLLASLEALSADAASAQPNGRSSVASHVEHLRYGLELLNRAARGGPLGEPDWAEAWRHQRVTEDEWRTLRASLASEARSWMDTMKRPPAWDETGLTDAMASIPHLAYHLGAIRQLAQGASGPLATAP
jgi:glyoxalase/bleomycin resistance protein/dioxygenase superfamily protein